MATNMNEKTGTTITCNSCKKSTINLRDVQSKGKALKKARSAGWRGSRKTDNHTCPSCQKENAKAEKKVGMKVIKGSKTKAYNVLNAKKSTAKANGAATFVGGQSIGKMAKSAKVVSQPAAE